MRFATVVLAALAALCPLQACQTIGPQVGVTRNDTKLSAASPVTLQIEDADKKGIANGVGPARYTSITDELLETMQSGTTPRDLWFRKLPDGTFQFNLSSGADFAAKGLEFSPVTGALKVDEFSTSASEPLRAGNEAYDKMVGYWTSMTQAQKDALLAEMDTVKAVAPTAGNVLQALIQAFSPIPVPAPAVP